MSFYTRRFNLYLLPIMAGLLVLCGCSTSDHKKDKDPIGFFRLHIESETSNAAFTKTITVVRSNPVEISINTDPILTEADLVAARLLNAPGGFAVELQFNETASWRLEQYSAINPGKHLAVFAQWDKKPEDGRWLAAPIIVRRIANARLSFTPDATHEETEKWVAGLNLAIKKNADKK